MQKRYFLFCCTAALLAFPLLGWSEKPFLYEIQPPPGWEEAAAKGEFLRLWSMNNRAQFGIVHRGEAATTEQVYERAVQSIATRFRNVKVATPEKVMMDSRVWLRFEVSFENGGENFGALYYVRGDENGSTEMKGWSQKVHFNQFREKFAEIASNMVILDVPEESAQTSSTSSSSP